MVFQESGNVPFCMTSQECIDTNFYLYYEPLLKYKTRIDLFGNLKSTNVYMAVAKGNRVDDMQDISCENSISVTKIIRGGKGKFMDG